MPPASRRSGTAHTSKGSSKRRGDVDQGEASSSSAGLGAEPLLSQHEEAETADETAHRIHLMLDKFDKKQEPLTSNNCDASLRSMKSDWSSMEGNFENVYQLITDIAERLADARAAEGLPDEDDNLQELDVGMRSMIDLHEVVKFRKMALEEIRKEVNDGTQVLDAAGMYESRAEQLQEEYNAKTVRQKYLHSGTYTKYKETVWAALREDDMPAMTDLLPYEINDGQDDDDDDIVAYGGDRHKYKCPISLQTMVEPVKSTVCLHAFEKTSILTHLGNSTKPCPVGCGKSINKNTLKEDPSFTNACRKFARREQNRKETQRTQVQATMLD